MFEDLFRPISLARCTLENRIAMAPMTRFRSPGGIPGEDVARYYRRRAEGGVGLIITEGVIIDHPAATAYDNIPSLEGGEALAGWRRVVDGVHDAGGRIFAQLWHVGQVRRPGTGRHRAVPGVGPVDIVEDGNIVVRAMTEDDMEEVAQSYGRSAAQAEEAGFDGVEIHGAHGYLLDQFLWEGSNPRTDSYGGTLENRVRFPLEVIREMRSRVSDGFPVLLRFSQWKIGRYDARLAATPEELGAILRPLAEAGVDAFHPSTRRFWEPAFEGSPDTLAAVTRALTGKPTITVGSIGLNKIHEVGRWRKESDVLSAVDLEGLEQRLSEATFDIIAVGRALLADPDWPIKLRRGDLADVRPLTQTCFDHLV